MNKTSSQPQFLRVKERRFFWDRGSIYIDICKIEVFNAHLVYTQSPRLAAMLEIADGTKRRGDWRIAAHALSPRHPLPPGLRSRSSAGRRRLQPVGR